MFAAVSAFAPVSVQRAPTATSLAATLPGASVDRFGNNVAVKELLIDIQDSGLLSKVAESGLLSKAQEAGITLSSLEPLLLLASEYPEVLVLVEASGPELLPLLPTIVKLAPPLLPLLATAISVPPALIGGAGVASLAAAAAAVVVIPDNSILQVAEQTLIVGVFGLAVPAISIAGAGVLTALKK